MACSFELHPINNCYAFCDHKSCGEVLSATSWIFGQWLIRLCLVMTGLFLKCNKLTASFSAKGILTWALPKQHECKKIVIFYCLCTGWGRWLVAVCACFVLRSNGKQLNSSRCGIRAASAAVLGSDWLTRVKYRCPGGGCPALPVFCPAPPSWRAPPWGSSPCGSGGWCPWGCRGSASRQSRS